MVSALGADTSIQPLTLRLLGSAKGRSPMIHAGAEAHRCRTTTAEWCNLLNSINPLFRYMALTQHKYQ